MEPGDIYLADFPETGPHPVIVVSREELNRGHYAMVVVCTSARFAVRRQLASCVPFRTGQFWLYGRLRRAVREHPVDRQTAAGPGGCGAFLAARAAAARLVMAPADLPAGVVTALLGGPSSSSSSSCAAASG
jgi:hypothetical protein